METYWLIGRSDMGECNDSMTCLWRPKKKPKPAAAAPLAAVPETSAPVVASAVPETSAPVAAIIVPETGAPVVASVVPETGAPVAGTVVPVIGAPVSVSVVPEKSPRATQPASEKQHVITEQPPSSHADAEATHGPPATGIIPSVDADVRADCGTDVYTDVHTDVHTDVGTKSSETRSNKAAATVDANVEVISSCVSDATVEMVSSCVSDATVEVISPCVSDATLEMISSCVSEAAGHHARSVHETDKPPQISAWLEQESSYPCMEPARGHDEGELPAQHISRVVSPPVTKGCSHVVAAAARDAGAAGSNVASLASDCGGESHEDEIPILGQENTTLAQADVPPVLQTADSVQTQTGDHELPPTSQQQHRPDVPRDNHRHPSFNATKSSSSSNVHDLNRAEHNQHKAAPRHVFNKPTLERDGIQTSLSGEGPRHVFNKPILESDGIQTSPGQPSTNFLRHGQARAEQTRPSYARSRTNIPDRLQQSRSPCPNFGAKPNLHKTT